METNLYPSENTIVETEDCPKPRDDMFEQMCELIGTKDVSYKEHLMKMSCVDKKKDSQITINSKIKHTWETYRKDFYCTEDGFSVKEGNILKYSIFHGFPAFVNGVVKNFQLDINFKDPADQKTLLDYIQDEIVMFKKLGFLPSKVKELEELYTHFRKNLNAKHSNEL